MVERNYKRQLNKEKPCAAPGCGDLRFTGEVCAKHYQWQRRNPGKPLPPPVVHAEAMLQVGVKFSRPDLERGQQLAKAEGKPLATIIREAFLAHLSAHQVVSGSPARKSPSRRKSK
jgi:hypothetical protein